MSQGWNIQTPKDGELALLFCGKRSCRPGDAVGPVVREHYLIHVCLSGMGTYRVQGEEYRLKAGEGFLILPGEVASYRADDADPWSLVWVGFTGTRAEEHLLSCGLSAQSRICRCGATGRLEHCVQEMIRYDTVGRGHELLRLGELYLFLGYVAQTASAAARRGRESGSEYVDLAVDYIKSHFQEDLTVAKLARYVGLNRSYLTTVFQNALHLSPQQFLMRYRMERAAQMLEKESLSVAEIARSCGYPDPLTFSKAFKRTIGLTPSFYRRNTRESSGNGQDG